ncbi:MmgE/PrpD family protein, partial [Candidatus Bathyarchaeota archaeon]
MTHLKIVLSRIIDAAEQLKDRELTTTEQTELKNAILDRIGCGLGARRIGIGNELSQYLEQNHCDGGASLWGNATKTSPGNAALINGALSSHLEYDAHDSMIPAVIALAEATGRNGLQVLESMRTGHYVGVIIRKLLASSVEKRGLHWPAYLASLTAAAACSQLLGLDGEKTGNAIAIAASMSPAAPFEAFTKGATVKDLYGGWGNMLGVQSAQLASTGLTGPSTVFEGERGLFRNWLGDNPDPEALDEALDIEDITMTFHIKPFPSCTAAHPTLTAIENLFDENPGLDPLSITRVEVDTYRFGADLSHESNPDVPIGAKVNLPYLAASILIHGELLPEHSEEPWLSDPNVRTLAERISVTCKQSEDELLTRTRSARIVVTLKDGSILESSADRSRWSSPRATQSEIHDKFRANVGNYLPKPQVE